MDQDSNKFELILDKDPDKLYDMVFELLELMLEISFHPNPDNMMNGFGKMAFRVLGEQYEEFIAKYKAKYGTDWPGPTLEEVMGLA